jgi:hypothetical protein
MSTVCTEAVDAPGLQGATTTAYLKGTPRRSNAVRPGCSDGRMPA